MQELALLRAGVSLTEQRRMPVDEWVLKSAVVQAMMARERAKQEAEAARSRRMR